MSTESSELRSETLERVRLLVAQGAVRFTRHGLIEMANDGLTIEDVVSTLGEARIVEDYPDATRGPSVLALHVSRRQQRPFHVVWGIESWRDGPAAVITAYRPDPRRWSADFMRRL